MVEREIRRLIFEGLVELEVLPVQWVADTTDVLVSQEQVLPDGVTEGGEPCDPLSPKLEESAGILAENRFSMCLAHLQMEAKRGLRYGSLTMSSSSMCKMELESKREIQFCNLELKEKEFSLAKKTRGGSLGINHSLQTSPVASLHTAPFSITTELNPHTFDISKHIALFSPF